MLLWQRGKEAELQGHLEEVLTDSNVFVGDEAETAVYVSLNSAEGPDADALDPLLQAGQKAMRTDHQG